MDTMFECCAGLDVHQKTVWACVRRLERTGRVNKESKRFGTMTRDLLELAAWLKERGVTHAADGVHRRALKPVYNILEEHVEVWLCNAPPHQDVPGRKTDLKDCEWIAQLLQCGLLRPSFVPPQTGARTARPDAGRERAWRTTKRAWPPHSQSTGRCQHQTERGGVGYFRRVGPGDVAQIDRRHQRSTGVGERSEGALEEQEGGVDGSVAWLCVGA